MKFNHVVFGYLIGGVFPLVVVLIGGGAIVSLIIALTSSRQRPPIYFPVKFDMIILSL